MTSIVIVSWEFFPATEVNYGCDRHKQTGQSCPPLLLLREMRFAS